MFSTRSRIYFGRISAFFLVIYILYFPPSSFLSPLIVELLELLGFVFICAASLGRIWCSVFISDRKNKELVAIGPYSVVRNPLYVFSLMGLIGCCMATEKPLAAIPAGIGFVIYYTIIIKKEEFRLLKFFGDTYSQYISTVNRWWPTFRLYHEPQDLCVSPVKFRKDILDAMWFLWVFLLCEAIEGFNNIVF